MLVCGGRDWDDTKRLWSALTKLAEQWPKHTAIIHGGARGVDSIAGAWARHRRFPEQVFKAAWDDLDAPGAIIKTHSDGRRYNANAGAARNQRMLDESAPDLVVAFPGGTGTADMVKRAEAAGVRVLKMVPR